MLNFKYDADAERRVLRKEAIEEGLKKGLEEGLEKGLEKGLKEGREEGISTLVIHMMSKGKSLDEISELIDIPKEELENLIKTKTRSN